MDKKQMAALVLAVVLVVCVRSCIEKTWPDLPAPTEPATTAMGG